MAPQSHNAPRDARRAIYCDDDESASDLTLLQQIDSCWFVVASVTSRERRTSTETIWYAQPQRSQVWKFHGLNIPSLSQIRWFSSHTARSINLLTYLLTSLHLPSFLFYNIDLVWCISRNTVTYYRTAVTHQTFRELSPQTLQISLKNATVSLQIFNRWNGLRCNNLKHNNFKMLLELKASFVVNVSRWLQ